MMLIPAVMHLLGDKAWWLPRRLDRILPNVDVEGDSLRRDRTPAPADPAAAAGPSGWGGAAPSPDAERELVGAGRRD
jgi:RND superfamily putative drug exporter